MPVDATKVCFAFDFEESRLFFCCEGRRLAFAREPACFAADRAALPHASASGMLM